MATQLPAKQIKGKLKPVQIDLTTASLGTDPCDRNYVNTQIQASIYGLDMKNSVRVASTSNVTLTAPGTAIDGVTLTVNDRVLLKNQTTASQNGIYIFNGSAATMTRSMDANTSAMVTSQLAVSVSEGTANLNTTWKLNTPDPLTLDTTALSFGLYSSSFYATPSQANKNMVAVVTVNDNDVACNTGLAATPAANSFVVMEVNGMPAKAGNATKLACEMYWSGDGGTTPRATGAVVAGDKPYWVQSVATFNLDINDVIDYIFNA